MPRNNWGYNKGPGSTDERQGRRSAARGFGAGGVVPGRVVGLGQARNVASKWWSEAAFSRPVGEFHQAAEVEDADEGEWNDVPTGATSGEKFVAPRGTGDQ